MSIFNAFLIAICKKRNNVSDLIYVFVRLLRLKTNPSKVEPQSVDAVRFVAYNNIGNQPTVRNTKIMFAWVFVERVNYICSFSWRTKQSSSETSHGAIGSQTTN